MINEEFVCPHVEYCKHGCHAEFSHDDNCTFPPCYYGAHSMKEVEQEGCFELDLSKALINIVDLLANRHEHDALLDMRQERNEPSDIYQVHTFTDHHYNDNELPF